ncbi:hypothetical protein MMC25_002368 [Agyrium rufum]|nr:hypothetical protein [Agyrium rufum]
MSSATSTARGVGSPLFSPGDRRSFTLPSRPSELLRTSSGSNGSPTSTELVEALFAHHTGKIVSFTALPPSNSSRRSLSSATGLPSVADIEPHTLPWASSSERTLAAGPIRIYRVPGSVAFLSSGQTLQPILSKSQCWCVDGETKFVLRVRQNSYYRIELPNTCPDDLKVAEELIRVFENVLQYEKTPCPFKRGFHVELPEPPETPVILKPWRPKARQSSLSTDFFSIPEGATRSSSPSLRTGSSVSTPTELSSDEAEPTELRSRRPTELTDPFETPKRPAALGPSRAMSEPVHRLLDISPLPVSRPLASTTALVSEIESLKGEASPIATDAASLSSSLESFDSFKSFHSPSSPLHISPPDSAPSSPSPATSFGLGLSVPRSRHHTRDVSELTITPTHHSPLHDFGKENERDDQEEGTQWFEDTTDCVDEDLLTGSITPIPKTPPLTNDSSSLPGDEPPWLSEAITPSPPQTALRQRIKQSRQRRSQSPLPPPANLYSPKARITGHHLTSALLQKTCALLLAPPVQLVALMLNIAARIANGTFGGSLEHGKRSTIPGTWEFSDDEGSESDNGWDEDDYGVSLTGERERTVKKKAEEKEDVCGSWEID